MTLLTRRHLLQTFAGASALAFMPRALAAPSTAGWVEDATLLQRIYEAMHPGLYRYNMPADITGAFDLLRSRLAGAPSRAAAWLAFSEATARIRCGHTQPNPYNQSDAIAAELSAGATCLPFLFEWIGGRMIVTRALNGDAGLKPGTEVVALGGEPAPEILKAMVPITRADGSNDAKRINLLSVRGVDDWETFDLFLAQLRPALVAQGKIALTLQDLDGGTRQTEAALMTRAERRVAVPPPASQKDKPWETQMLADGVAWLKMPDWTFYNAGFDWRAALDAELDTIAGAAPRALVVDIRGNEGGDEVGALILARFIDAPRSLGGRSRLTRYRTAPAEFVPFLDTWDPSFLDWGAAAKGPDADGYYNVADSADAAGAMLKPDGKRIKAKLVVVTGAANSSATFQFASQTRELGLGTLIGQPTGGNRRGINGGAFFFVRLPNSGLEADLPLIGQYPLQQQPDAGLVPDVTVERTARHIADGTDAERDAVLTFLKA